MRNVTNHERAGVYSVYEASSVVSSKTVGAVVGLVACCDTLEDFEVQTFYHYDEAVDALGAKAPALRLVELALQNGASAVCFSPVLDEDGYADALQRLNEKEEPYVIICDTPDKTVHAAVKAAVEKAAGLRRERLAVVCGEGNEDSAALIARAALLNAERVVLVAPGAKDEALPGPAMAAAVAGLIAGETDPAVPLGGAIVRGLSDVSMRFAEDAVDSLVRGGVTVVERLAGELSVVRGVSSRTKSGDAPDATWRELGTIRIVDDVIPGIRNALRARFTRSKNSEQVRNAIRSQVILELENKLRREIIAAYGEVRVEAMPDNPTVCLVDFSFRVTHGLNQIWLSAKITV